MAGPSLRPPARPAGLGAGPAAGLRGERRVGPGRAEPGGAAAGPDTHRDDGGALAPLPPVSLSLGLPSRAPAAASAASAAPAASLRPRRSRLLTAPQPVPSLSGSRFQRRPGPGRRQPLPGKYRSPRALSPGGGAARPGLALRAAAAARPGAEWRPLPVASSRGGFCKSHKMARAPNLRSEKRRSPSGGGDGGSGSGGGFSARRAQTARPRSPHRQTLAHTLTHARTLALAHAHSHTHSHTHTGPARSPAAAAAPTAAAGTAAEAAAAAPAPPARGVRSLSPTWAAISSSDGSSLPGSPRRGCRRHPRLTPMGLFIIIRAGSERV